MNLDLDGRTEEEVTGTDPEEKPDKQGRVGKAKGGRPKGSSSRPPAAERELQSRTGRIVSRITDRLEERGDHELATALQEDGDAMVGGLVELTRRFTALRTPLLLILGLVEPVLAFGRVGRILIRRAQWRREEAAAAAAREEMAGQDQEFMGGVPVPHAAPVDPLSR